MPCARERRPRAGSPDARGDATAGGGRVESGVPPGGCRGVAGHGPGHGVWLAGALPGGRPGGAERPPGAGAAAEAVRRADAPALHADRRDRSAAAGVRVRAVDPGHAAHADPPRVSGVAVGGQRRSAAAHPGLVAAAAPVAGLAGRPRRCAALARRGLPGDPRAGQGRGRHGVLRRRGRDPLGPPRPSWSNSSLPPPTGDCDCSCCPPTPRSSTPTSGS